MEYASAISLGNISHEDIVVYCQYSPSLSNNANSTRVVKPLPGMEFVSGATLESHSVGPEVIMRIINAIDHLPTLPIPPYQGPGPVYDGIAQGCL